MVRNVVGGGSHGRWRSWYRLGGSKKGRSRVGVVRLRGLVVSDPLLLVLLMILGYVCMGNLRCKRESSGLGGEAIRTSIEGGFGYYKI